MDLVSLRRLVAGLRAGGVDGFFAGGSTGESPLLDERDRPRLIEAVRAAAPTALIFAGLGGGGISGAVRQAGAAAAAGADVAVLMSPHFLSFDQSQITAYAEAVADRSELPLALYHHLRMPTALTVATVARLARHPRIVALKDTSGGEHDRCAEILAATAGLDFEFYQGVEKLVLPTLRAGGHGCVVAQANIAPTLFRAVLDAWRQGEVAAAEAAQARVTALWSVFGRDDVRRSFCHFLMTLKLPLQQRGIIATTACAMPGMVRDPAFEQAITDFMREHLPAGPGAMIA